VSSSFTDSLSRQVQFFTGKGGVGKSTVLGAVALAAAQRGQKPLIVELGEHAGPLPGFNSTELDYTPTVIAPGVHATRISFEPALLDYMTSRLRLRPLASAVASNQALRRLFLAAPGVDELVVLHRIEMLAAEGRWHPILVDLESTGHALMFFDLPGVMSGVLSDGPVRRVVDSASILVRDATRCVVHLVTAPEDLIVSETIRVCWQDTICISVRSSSIECPQLRSPSTR
jgi:arsenite/tail-anchored protein-transporting ATPase